MKTKSELRSEMWPTLPYKSDLDIECDEARTAMLIARDAYDTSGLAQREACWDALCKAEETWRALQSRAVRQF